MRTRIKNVSKTLKQMLKSIHNHCKHEARTINETTRLHKSVWLKDVVAAQALGLLSAQRGAETLAPRGHGDDGAFA